MAETETIITETETIITPPNKTDDIFALDWVNDDDGVLPLQSTFKNMNRAVQYRGTTQASMEDIDTIINREDAGTVYAEQRPASVMGGGAQDWTASGALSWMGDVSYQLGADIQPRPFPKSTDVTGERMAAVMSTFAGGGGPEPIMMEEGEEGGGDFQEAFKDTSLTFSSVVSDGGASQRYAQDPEGLIRTPAPDGAKSAPNPFSARQSTIPRRDSMDLEQLRDQQLVSDSPFKQTVATPPEGVKSSKSQATPRFTRTAKSNAKRELLPPGGTGAGAEPKQERTKKGVPGKKYADESF